MGTITFPNFRTTADVKMNTKLKDGGVYIEWSSLTEVKAWIWSDAQKALAGRVDVSVDTGDATVLKCLYASTKPQYPGVNRLIVQGRYNGSLKTYDKPVFNFVPRTAEATGSITISDPEVDVEIEVTDTTSSILDNTIAAALAAAAHAEHAASLVPLQVLQDCEAATAVALTAASKAPVIGENGNWWVWNSVQEAYVDTGKQAKGDPGKGIASFTVVESQEDDADNVVTVTFTDGTTETFNVKNGKTGNGIASIVQTVESPDDAGTNVIMVTMTDGTVVTFNVKNGSKGQPGAAQAAYKSVETLPEASAETMDKIYLTPSGTANVYNMSYTDFDGANYSWVSLGTTSIQLSDYATKAEFTQLREKVGELEDDINGVDETQYEAQSLLADHYYGTNGSTMAYPSGYGNANGVYCSCVEVTPGEKYKITGKGGNQYSLLYVTADSNRGKLRYPSTNYDARTNPVEITIEEGEKYLYVNLNSYDSQTDKFEKEVQVQAPGLKDKVAEHTTEITALQGDFADIDTLKYRKPKLYASNASPNYEQYIQEAYIVKLPAGSVILKRYGSDVYFYTKSSGVYARAALSSAINGKPVPVKVYNTNDSVNYPENLVVGYIVFSDVAGFSSASSVTSETAYIVREVAENIAYSPIISASLDEGGDIHTENIEVSLPSTIYAVVGDTLQLYYRSIFRCVDYSRYAVKVVCDIGAQYPRYYEVTPLAGNVGTHTLEFTIKDNNNVTLGTKTVSLVVVAAGTSPSSEINVLCLGASATSGGQWASELKRRLTASGGSPAGSGLSNILFVGRKDVTHNGTQVKLEATGGYSFPSYTSTATARYRFNVTAENEPTINVGDVYSNNGNTYTVKEINISAGEGGYFSCEGTGAPQSSGVLTKVSGTGSETITYGSTSFSGNPFVYDGAINMQQYADDFCNPQNAEHGRIDVVYTELFGNGTSPYTEDFTTRLSQMQALITQIRAVFPNCKFCIGLFWNPDLRGGMGRNYGATGAWSDPYGIKYSNMNLCLALQKYITDNNLSSYVFITNWLNEFDEWNDMQQTTKKVNPRSDVTEIFGLNGVHPSNVGYYQMADTAWRLFIAKFCQQ